MDPRPPVNIPRDEVSGAVDAAIEEEAVMITLERNEDGSYKMTVVL
jgi:hypothetical protein